MGITVGWDDEQHSIACYIFSDGWTWQDLSDKVKTMHEMVREVSHKVDFIADLQSTHLPAGNSIAAIRQAIRAAPPNAGLLVIINGDAFTRTMGTTIARLNKHTAYASTREIALMMIAKRKAYRLSRAAEK